MSLNKKIRALKIQSAISSAGLLLAIIIILSLAFVFFFYQFKKDKDEFTTAQRRTLSFVRFIYILLISVLIISPLLEIIKTRFEKPILIVGIDNSQSMASNKSDADKVISVKNELFAAYSQKYDLQLLTFGEKVTPNAEPNFSEQTSNYSEFLDEIDKRYYNLNVGAIVLVGDGIFNKGENPVQQSNQFTAPLYSIGIGDTTSLTDQAIVNATHNQNVFLGNTFPVEIEAAFFNFKSPKSLLQVFVGSKLSYSEEIEVPQSDYYYNKTINLKAEKAGLENVTIQLAPFEGEKNVANNTYRFSIEVHENKYNVLFLTQGPHPDIGAFSITLDKQSNFKVTIANPSQQIADLEKYNLIVLNQLPSLNFQQTEYFKKIMNAGTSLLVTLGPNSSISAFNNLGLDFSLATSTSTQESFPFFNESYSIFSLPGSIKDVSAVYPPLMNYFTQFTVGSEYSVLAYQKINNIEMNYPLIATGLVNNRKIGIICGEGIWRWRMTEFQNFGNQAVFEQLFVNLFNYLSLKEVREQFTVEYKHISPETSPVRIKAQVFNNLFEPVPNSEIHFTLTDSTNKELNFIFDTNGTDYNLNLGFLSPGKYSFKASTHIGEKEFTKEGNFAVEEINLEQQNNQANFKMLYTLSLKSGGKFFTLQNWKELLSSIDKNQNIKIKSHKEKNIYELIDWKWYFIAIFLLLSLEWFLRKYWGSY